MNIKPWTDKKIMEGANPIYLKGSSGIGVLLLHGWSSSPQEFNPSYVPSLAKHLNRAGYTVYIPLRIGQGTEPKDLIGLTWEDWVKDALKHYDDLAKEVDHIVVGGMSTGANLALEVSLKRKVLGVIPMGTTIFMNYHPLFVFLMMFKKKSNKIKTKTYFKADRKIATKKTHYNRYPYSSLYENLRASLATRRILPQVKAPILIMHSSDDNVIHPSSTKYIYKNVGSENKELVWIEDSYHSFTTDKHADQANETIERFINKISSK